MDARLILFPQGQPTDPASRERCTQLLLRAGGDVRRIIDSPVTSLPRFASYVARVRGLDREALAPLVVMIQTAPLGIAVLEARRRLQAGVPALARASWIIYADLVKDPRFPFAADACGSMDAELADVPIWTAENGMRFVVLSHVADPRLVSDALKLYERQPVEDSGSFEKGAVATDASERETIRPRAVVS